MSCDYRCPYCGAEIEEDCCDLHDGEHLEVECEDCGRWFEVAVEFEPRYEVIVPEELADCWRRCPRWSLFDECCDRNGRDAADGCPLGYDKDGSRQLAVPQEREGD